MNKLRKAFSKISFAAKAKQDHPAQLQIQLPQDDVSCEEPVLPVVSAHWLAALDDGYVPLAPHSPVPPIGAVVTSYFLADNMTIGLEAERDALIATIEPLVKRLPAGTLRAVASMRCIDGLSCIAIAKTLHYSRGYIYKLMNAAIDMMRELEKRNRVVGS